MKTNVIEELNSEDRSRSSVESSYQRAKPL
jgi:hypothetical protein